MDSRRAFSAALRRTAAAVVLLAVCAVASLPAQAWLSRAQLRKVGVFPPAGATLPLSLVFHDTTGMTVRLRGALGGTPALLLFSDFACKSLCGPILTMTSAALLQSGLKAGRDFHLVVIGLRANGKPAQARAFVRPQLAAPIARATRILIANSSSLAAATHAVGYRYLYDSQHDQFAHPTAAFVLTPSGKLAAMLSAPGIRATDLRLALLSAGAGKAETIADRLRLLCYCYDPATGIYTAAIGRMVDAAACATVLALGGAVWLLRRKDAGRHA